MAMQGCIEDEGGDVPRLALYGLARFRQIMFYRQALQDVLLRSDRSEKSQIVLCVAMQSQSDPRIIRSKARQSIHQAYVHETARTAAISTSEYTPPSMKILPYMRNYFQWLCLSLNVLIS